MSKKKETKKKEDKQVIEIHIYVHQAPTYTIQPQQPQQPYEPPNPWQPYIVTCGKD